MIVFFNGEFVPEEHAVVSVFDRSFQYGDGLFETVRILQGRPFRWQQHLERLVRGAAFLKLHLPFSPAEIAEFADQLIARNQVPDCLLRVTLSRGVGPRGYSPKGAQSPLLVMSLHPPPLGSGAASPARAGDPQPLPRWRLMTASFRLPANEPLAQFKTCNKLPQILARAQADAAGADEALLLNTDGWVVEGASSNLFWIDSGRICTPPLDSGILPGITRGVVFELCDSLGLAACESQVRPADLGQTEGVFLALTSLGIVEAQSLDGRELRVSPLVAKLCLAYADLLRREIGRFSEAQDHRY